MFIFVMAKLNVQHHFSSFQCQDSLMNRNALNIMFTSEMHHIAEVESVVDAVS